MPSPLPNALKKHGFLISFDRFFTRQHNDAFDLIHFAEPIEEGDETTPALECPENWSALAAEILAEHAMSRPSQLKAVEENTVPSWLWRHISIGKTTERENSAKHIFDRLVGAATYKGWQQDIFADENQARNFYDEARYALAQRFIAIEPSILSQAGSDWAYGLKTVETHVEVLPKTTNNAIELANKTIDDLVGGHSPAKLQKLLSPKNAEAPVKISFRDTIADWGQGSPNNKAGAALDLMTFRHNDGTVNIDAVRHATKLLVIVLDLIDAPLSIGFVNLAPLLMALAIPYDSDAGRNLAASISALIAAEAYATSAELAAMRGATPHFTDNREQLLRSLRNQRRAVYGEHNDYEKLSVLPTPLDVKKSPDLALVAAAQRRWDEVLDLARQHGLRHGQVTGMSLSADMALFLESNVTLTPAKKLSAPVVAEALSRLGYDRNSCAALMRHIAGHKTLISAPVINHVALRAKGFDAVALEAIEDYLPTVNDVRLAFTPWILGQSFCRQILKISAQKLQNAGFDLLKHMGFSESAVSAANAFYYGHGTVTGSKDLKDQHASVFAQNMDVSNEARIKMAAAVQSFTSEAIDLDVSLPSDISGQAKEKLLLSAWRQGLRAITFTQNLSIVTAPNKKTKSSVSAFLHTRPRPAMPARSIKTKASHSLVSLKPTAPKATDKSRRK